MPELCELGQLVPGLAHDARRILLRCRSCLRPRQPGQLSSGGPRFSSPEMSGFGIGLRSNMGEIRAVALEPWPLVVFGICRVLSCAA